MSSKAQALKDDLNEIVQKLSLDSVDIINIPFIDSNIDCVKLFLPHSFNLYLIPSHLYPHAPPTALMNWGNENIGTLLPLEWEWDENNTQSKLLKSISKYIDGSPPYNVSWGVSIHNPLTRDEKIAKNNFWKKFLIGASENMPSTTEASKQRVESGTVNALTASSVTIVGLGSVGSYMIEQLVRSGLSSVTLIDPDIVEISNISRTTYTLNDIGQKKTDALAVRLRLINPNLIVNSLPSSLQSTGGVALKNVIENSTIIIAATDDPHAQSLINSCSFYSKVPAVFVGLYKGAKGGEVAITIPSVTPCLQCMTGLRRNIDPREDQVSRNMDYGSNRLAGEIALNSDIQHVSSAALKICYSLITSLKGETSSVSNFVPNAIAQERHFLTLSMEPDYWFYPEIFKEIPGQYAFQSVWLTASSSEDCHICGSKLDNQENPYEYIKSTPNPNNIRNQI